MYLCQEVIPGRHQNVRQACFILRGGSRFHSIYIICEATKLSLSLSCPEKGQRGLRGPGSRELTLRVTVSAVSSNSPGSS